MLNKKLSKQYIVFIVLFFSLLFSHQHEDPCRFPFAIHLRVYQLQNENPQI